MNLQRRGFVNAGKNTCYLNRFVFYFFFFFFLSSLFRLVFLFGRSDLFCLCSVLQALASMSSFKNFVCLRRSEGSLVADHLANLLDSSKTFHVSVAVKKETVFFFFFFFFFPFFFLLFLFSRSFSQWTD